MENERNTTRIKEMNLAERVLLYETDQMSEQEMISLFQDLVDTGMAWKLQGHYGRTSMILLDAGVIAPPEDVLRGLSTSYRDQDQKRQIYTSKMVLEEKQSFTSITSLEVVTGG